MLRGQEAFTARVKIPHRRFLSPHDMGAPVCACRLCPRVSWHLPVCPTYSRKWTSLVVTPAAVWISNYSLCSTGSQGKIGGSGYSFTNRHTDAQTRPWKAPKSLVMRWLDDTFIQLFTPQLAAQGMLGRRWRHAGEATLILCCICTTGGNYLPADPHTQSLCAVAKPSETSWIHEG